MVGEQIEQAGAELTVAQRRRRVAAMTAAGYTQREIAEALTAARYPSATKSTIGRDVIRNEQVWREDVAGDVQKAKQRHTQQIDETIEAFRRQMMVIKDVVEAAEFHTAHIFPLLKERAKLLGLYAPTRIDVTDFVRRWAREQGYDENRAVELAMQVVESTGF